MSGSNQDRTKRVDLSINRLISQLIPDNPRLSDEDAQQRHDQFFDEIKQLLNQPRPPPLADQNHASELIRRKLVQTNPSQALRYSNLYSRLLALPVLNQKWAMLYLLYQLADSPDPTEPDPVAFAEFQQEQARRRRKHEEREDFASSGPPNQGNADAYTRDPNQNPNPNPNPDDSYHPTELRDVLKNPKDMRPLDGDSQRPSSPSSRRRSRGSKDEPPSPPKRDVAIKSKLLADNYSDFEPSEPVLLRDLPYTLQGLSSATLPFAKEDSLKLPPTLPPPLIGLLHTLAEPSLLYRGLEEFVKTPAKGLLAQSLRAAISTELRSYLTLVATLEGQIRRALSTIDEKAPRSGIGKAGVTLKRCVVWTREATMGLRLMSMIAEESKSKKGGQLISLIHSLSSSHGDPIVGAFAEQLLMPVTRPFYDILRQWIYDGELSDPYLEFFVQEQPVDMMPKGKTGSISVWDDKYMLDPLMIPSIITMEFCEKVFLIGKSLNFIRHSCGDAQWVESYSKESSKQLSYGDTATLETWIDEAYKTTMRRLLHLMTNKFHLFEHLQALKSYILLGQGDFIALLMESLAANLDRPAGAQYRHTLTAQLEHAIRGSNAQYDSPEVLRRLDARMLQLSHGDIGWDCFTLEYKIDAPVDVVVSDWGNRQYLKVFNFLWRIKRVEFALSSTWRKVTTGSRGVLQTDHAAVRQTWKTTRGHLAEMVHFVGQLQYYILFEVIESSWTELQERLQREDATLDDVIEAHTTYLNSITHKGLLGARRRRFVGSNANAAAAATAASASASTGGSGTGTGAGMPAEEDDNSYMIQLGELLRTMLAYRDCVDGLYSWSVSDFTQRQEAGLRSSSADGDDDDDDGEGGGIPGGPHSEFPALRERLRNLGDRFRTKLQILLGDLAYQPDVDLRFLGVVMNFNDVYQPVRRKPKSSTSGAGGSATAAAASAASSAAATAAGGGAGAGTGAGAGAGRGASGTAGAPGSRKASKGRGRIKEKEVSSLTDGEHSRR
ncbi:Spc98 family-domain-containing protein [Durotheca rogersii]|uniref:Spc98 family-domain-containing protein n=1 Tax=Durotheca rogersii TaxID=419775 RepID=UPI00221EADF2|nr:Spc98 family-domain-containing protein [Durotheca rogersii]KAI5861233.1 Spc98 family-domain-containing protein [Durotheca rogersii]